MTLDIGGSTENVNDTRSSVSKLIKRFNEVSAWISRLIVSQPSHDERRAVLSCILRIALSSWNIGNFNGAMEILAGLKSNKLKFFWHTITEKETLPVLDFLSAALMSVEYDRALNRALAIAECRVVPFFGAFLRELREILSDAVNSESEQQKIEQRNTSATSRSQREQRQVFISDYNGEDYYFTRIGPSGLFNVDKIYRVQAVMDHISLCHQHFHTLTRISPAPTLMDYLKIQSNATGKQCVFAVNPQERDEIDAEYEDDCDNYNPVQPLIHDHGISFVGLSSSQTKIDQHLIQVLHHGCTVVLSEGSDSQSAPNGILFYLRLDRSSSTLTWVRPSWSALKTGTTTDSETYAPDFNLAFNPEESLAPGILTKLALQTAGEMSSGNTLDDGYLDLSTVKEISLGGRDVEKDAELTAIGHRYGLDHNAGNESAITILYGNSMTDNRILYMICPAVVCRLWYVGLTCIVRSLVRQQQHLSDRRLLWLREQYLQLYHEGGYCCGPLAADALRAFGGKDWSLTSKKGDELDETSSALRREVSMKIKKKQLLHNQTLKDRCLRGSFVEPVTMCMESTYWQNPMYHRQSTPATSLEPQIDVIRHHSLGHLAVTQTQPKFERERHGSTEHLWYGRHPRVGSVLYDTQLDFIEFVKLYRSFSLLIRKDLRDLFEQLAVTFRSLSVTANAKDFLKDTSADKKKQRIGLITRNHDYEGVRSNPQKKIYDAIAAASIFSNCTGIDTKHSQVITLSTFTKFLECRQMETRTEDEVKALIKRHEPDAFLSSQFCLSFEGFARYLMDKDNYAFVNERMVWDETEMNRPLSEYFIASSHNTYLTGHQLKGESSVELYGQVLLSGCRCVELDCWDGEDGYPIIYHGHTFTTKIPFNAVVEEINQYAFIASPYPVILSIENHCSLQQQTRMAQTFQKVFGDKLVKSFIFDVDFSDEPVLPTPDQLKRRILIKNKKLNVVVPTPLVSYQPNVTSTPVRPVSVASRYSIPGRTSSIISNTSSSSFNDDFSDDDFDDEDDDDNIYEKATHMEGSDTPRSSMSHTWAKNSSTKKAAPDDKLRKRSSQISKELSDLVNYVQAIKFRGLNIVSPNSSVKQRQRPSVISDSVIEASESLPEAETKEIRPNTNIPCYQCTSINENTAKRLSRKQPLALLAHTQTQLMRTYPAGMRIDSSNFNPVIFWSFGIQMAALNYQTDDVAMHLNSAMFEVNGRCGFISKPSVMRSQSHVMYRRFNPWDKEFDGLHSVHVSLNIISGQYVYQNNLTVSTFVEVEVIGIPADCNKRRTKIIQKNALNPIWNDIFTFRVMFQDLAFVRFSVIDSSNNHLLAQRVLPLKCLKPGYRHLRLRTPQNRPLYMSTLFIYSRVDEESFNHADKEEESTEKPSASDSGYLSISGTPLSIKRRMFFLTVYGVVADEPYTIFKLTQETTTQEVLLQALQKAGLPAERVNDHILVEEVARGWEKKDHDLPLTQRILDLNDHPLEAQSMWKGEGRFVLKRVGDDPSSRAWLSSIRSVSNRLRNSRGSDSNAWDENDNFLVCIYNVSPQIPYAILKVPLNACAQDVLTQALVKARRLEDPVSFVIIEELEWGGPNQHLQQRIMEDDENVYNAQSQWQTLGRFMLQERQYATPVSLRKNKPTSSLRLITLDRITRSFNVARNSIKIPVQTALSDSGSSKSQDESLKCKKNFRKREINREVHSDGETLNTLERDIR